MGDEVLLDLDDAGIATVTLNRPDKLNIFNLAMRDALIEAVTAVRDLPDARVMILRANGRHFSAGADLSEFGSAPHHLEARRIRWDRDPWGPLWDLPQPTIAALHGHAVGSGLEMALLCDLRFASADTSLGLPETKLGMLPAAGGTQSLTRAVGPASALPVVLGGASMDAERARLLGIVHEVVDDVEASARQAANRLALCDRGVLSAARRALHAAGDLALDAGLALEKRLESTTRNRPHRA
ncbi:MAG: enoyl-CoA hydratase/isomerase family protein [Acidimicrobiia bacterium]|nr:enoyl-CoA hydratase/isomerase family protein [Acidimicrobiia bacterium]